MDQQRRQWLQWLGASTVGGLAPWRAWAQRSGVARLLSYPFGLGVASGSPTQDGMVLWTRVHPEPELPLAVELSWELAEDEAFRHIVRRGSQVCAPHSGYAAHVELQGLASDRWYHYRFMLGDAISPIGRTRTLAAAQDLPQQLRLGFASCQRWEHGFYAAWRHLAAQNPDLIVFLGDYIYEYASPRGGVAPHASSPTYRVHGLRHARSLGDYRNRYALHKSDPALQAAHAACPWLVTWDDHEVENDYAGEWGRAGITTAFRRKRAAAYQAFYENMPLRASVLIQGLHGLGSGEGEALRLYARSQHGRLASFHLLDDRQFRAVQACRPSGVGGASAVRAGQCADLSDPGRSMLGSAQEQWLAQGLQLDSANQARWSVIGQQTLFSARRYSNRGDPLVPADSWDGYPAARQRLTDALVAHSPRNAVLLGGDIHQNYVCQVLADYSRPDSAVVASEFCGTSITSHSSATVERAMGLMRTNPHILLARPDQRGYGLANITPGRWETSLMVVEDPGRADSPVHPQARFVVEDGRAGPIPD
jgi:alkaline phosphatase D